jgi:hypothetical protein
MPGVYRECLLGEAANVFYNSNGKGRAAHHIY